MKRILLAEDDSFIVDIYATQFKREGYVVDVAKDGQMALEKIRQSFPDLLVLDIGLPKIDGWELLKLIREDEKLRGLRVIVVSNFNQKDFLDNITHYGVIKYFLKIETTPEEIINCIKEILK